MKGKGRKVGKKTDGMGRKMKGREGKKRDGIVKGREENTKESKGNWREGN